MFLGMTKFVEWLVPRPWHSPCARCRLPCGAASARRRTTLVRWIFVIFVLSSVVSLILVLVQTAGSSKYKVAKDSSLSPEGGSGGGGSGQPPTAVDQQRLLQVYPHQYDSNNEDPERKKTRLMGEATESYDHALPSQLPSDDAEGATETRTAAEPPLPPAGGPSGSSVSAKDSVSKKKDAEVLPRRNSGRRKKVDYSLLSLGVLKFSKGSEIAKGRRPAEEKWILQNSRRRRPGPLGERGGTQGRVMFANVRVKENNRAPGGTTRSKRADNASAPGEGLPPILLELDYNRPSYFPWRNAEDGCRNFATRSLVSGSGPRVPLSSFPGGGNTWLRYLVEAATGVFTGSIYHDEALAVKGMWGERDDYRAGTTLLQKTHSKPLLQSDLTKNGTRSPKDQEEIFFLLSESRPRRAVLLLRNPFECMLALRHYHMAGHTGFASRDAFVGPGWKNFTLERALAWKSLAESWLTLRNVSLLVIHFEHLRYYLEREMLRLISFLGIPIDYSRLNCLLRYPEGRFHRPRYHRHLQGYSFPKEAIGAAQDALHQVDLLLRGQGHPPLPLELYTYVPEPIVTPPSAKE
ncbi:uncharacterized protein LOC143020815 [Oratosquilla oratoria]|uniref:uncharacterized protein LOC143020815 n=1 Tax=Oratosquilla oratoria TaxID=337810 RepID=UPI003F765FC6